MEKMDRNTEHRLPSPPLYNFPFHSLPMSHNTLYDYGAQNMGETRSFTGGSFLSRSPHPDPYLPVPVGSGASIDAESHFLQHPESPAHHPDITSPWRFEMAPHSTLNPLNLSTNQAIGEVGDNLALESDVYLNTPSPPDSLPSLTQSRTCFNGLNEYEHLPEEHTMHQPDVFRDPEYVPGDNTQRSNQAVYHFPLMAESRVPPEYAPSHPGSTAHGPPSPATSLSSVQSRDFNTRPYTSKGGLDAVPESNSLALPEEMEEDGGSTEEPYARLIWKALMSAPGNRMVLREIYEWFENNTNKAKNSDSKGWQNSIRHNLSMNAAFEGVKDASSPGDPPRKSGNAWMLTEKAKREGVQSTTRYRKQGINKKAAKSENPAPQRQRSGAKGGRAAKKTAKLRRVVQDELKDEATPQQKEIILENYRSGDVPIQAPDITHGQTISPATPTLNIPPDAFDLANVGGCIDVADDSPLFYTDSETGEDAFFSNFSFSGVHEPESDFNHLVGL